MEKTKDAMPAAKIAFDVALERLELKRAELYRYLKEGKIKGVKEDGALFFEAAEVEKLHGELQAVVAELGDGLDTWALFFAERLGERAPEVDGEGTEERVAALGGSILHDLVRLEGDGIYLDPLQKGYRLLYSIRHSNNEIARFAPALAEALCGFFARLAPLPAVDAGRERVALGAREIGGAQRSFRLTAMPTLLGELLHLHLLEAEARGLEPLGYIPEQAAALRRCLDGRPGAVVLAGAADAEADRHRMALAHELSAAGRLVVSLEHRLHRRSELLVQIDLSQPEGPGFDALWRTALGMEPDAVFIDEIRSPEEAQALVEGAQSGAVVVAQVRAGSARHGLERLKGFEVDRLALAESLLAVIERRTFRRLCPQCRVHEPLEAKAANPAGGTASFRAVGCQRCGDGFEGRQALFGFHPVTDPLAEWLRAPSKDAGPFPLPPDDLGLGAALRQAIEAGTVPAGAARPYEHLATKED